MEVNFIIIGQGLAGTLLARSLLQRNQKILVVDNNWKNSASKVAAGLMTPLTGQRFTLTPEYPELFKTAQRELSELGVFRSTRVYRMFVDAEQRARGLKRAGSDVCAPFIEKITEGAWQISSEWSDEFGGAMMHGAWVDLLKLLSESAQELKSAQLLRTEEFNYDDVVVTDSGVKWRDVSARGIIFCDGYRSASSGPFSYLPWQPAKGEAISFNSDAPDSSVVLNRQGWALPLGEGRWRAGTNWEWESLNEVPTESQNAKFQKRFKEYFEREVSVHVTDHVAGVRPCTSDNHPFIGTHPEHARLHLFNGMGPRGTVWAPTLAQEMADYLVEAKPIRASCDLRRFTTGA